MSDSWLLLVAGREIAEHGIPGSDRLTVWTLGREWIDQQWLAHLGGYALYRVSGFGGLALVNAAAALAALALALAGARLRGASARSSAFVAIPCAVALLPFAPVRPQTLAYVFFVALFLLLDSSAARVTRRTLLCLPVLLVWANTHGSALLGAALVSVWAATQIAMVSSRRLAIRPGWTRFAGVAAAAWLCLLATPYSVSVFAYYRQILFRPAFGEVVTEWMRPSLPNQTPFFVLAAVAAMLMVTPRPRYSLFARVSLVAVTVAGFTALRHTAWLPLLLAILAPAALDALWRPHLGERRTRVNVVIAAAAAGTALGFAAASVAKPRSSYEQPLRATAARAAAAAAERTAGVVFADPQFANWLLWREPALAGRVAFDARFELLTDGELRRAGAFFRRSDPDWRRAADCCRVFVLSTEHTTTRVLQRDPEIQVAHADPAVTVLVRSNSP